MFPMGTVSIQWNPKFAYAIGLLTTDGSLSKDGRHISFTSKDKQLVQFFRKSLNLPQKIGRKASGKTTKKKYFQIQFGDVLFYRFLLKIGLMPRKSKVLSYLKIPKRYFFDFLRGHMDGDGSVYSYFDPRWKKSFMVYTVFCSASLSHINWLRSSVYNIIRLKGHINRAGRFNPEGKKTLYQLKFAKKESLKLFKYLYPYPRIICLQRKYKKVQKILAQVEELADSLP